MKIDEERQEIILSNGNTVDIPYAEFFLRKLTDIGGDSSTNSFLIKKLFSSPDNIKEFANLEKSKDFIDDLYYQYVEGCHRGDFGLSIIEKLNVIIRKINIELNTKDNNILDMKIEIKNLKSKINYIENDKSVKLNQDLVMEIVQLFNMIGMSNDIEEHIKREMMKHSDSLFDYIE